MILECTCGKKYRSKDDAPNRPTKCPACGGALKVSLSATATVPVVQTDARARELEARVRDLEKQLAEARSAGPGPAVTDKTLQDQLDQLRASSGRADQLQHDNLALRSEMERQLKERDGRVSEAQAALDRESGERRRLEAQLKGMEGTRTQTIGEKQKTIDALDASLTSYRSKVDQLQGRADSADAARASDAASFESRLRSREQEVRSEFQKGEEAHRHALADLRTTLEQQIVEKDRQITEGRQLVDREAGERRRLNEVLARLQQTADRTVAEKQKAVEALEANVASYRSKLDSLQKRVDDLEQLRRSDQDSYTSRLSARDGAQARLTEGGHLAADLDHSLEGLSAVLGGLRDRVRRLKDTLKAPPVAEPEPVRAAAPPPDPDPKPVPVVPLALSQTAGFDAMLTPAAAPVAPAPEPEPEPERAPEPAPEPEHAPEPEFEPVQEEPAPVEDTPAPEPQPELPVAEAAAPAHEEPEDVVPLISPPDDPAMPEPQPPPSAPEPKKKSFVSRFSWRKK